MLTGDLVRPRLHYLRGELQVDLLPPAKRALSRVSLGFGARAPRLTRGLMP